VAVKIRLKRMGKIRAPYYRIVAVDSRKKRDGRVIEEIGKYHPKEEPSMIEVKSERAQYWLGVGAQPSEAVTAILKVTGDWQKFKGEPGSEGTLKVAAAKRDKAEIFNEALKESAHEPKAEAVTKKAAAKKTEKAEPEKADKAETEKAEPEKADKADKAETEKADKAEAEKAEKAEKADETPAADATPADETPAADATPADETPEVAAAKADAGEAPAESTEA
jgi:small subunit ribosomal protein S16